MSFWDEVLKAQKKVDPIGGAATDATHYISTHLVRETSRSLADLADHLGISSHLPRYVQGKADKDVHDESRWAENTAGSAGAIYGGISAAGEGGAGGGAAAGGGEGAGAGASADAGLAAGGADTTAGAGLTAGGGDAGAGAGLAAGDGGAAEGGAGASEASAGAGEYSGDVTSADSMPSDSGYDWSKLARLGSNQQQGQGGGARQQQPEEASPGIAAAQPVMPNTEPTLQLAKIGDVQPPQTPLPDPDQQYLHSLPLMDKIGLALQAFSAGVAGRGSPITERLQQRRQQQQDFQAQTVKATELMGKGMEAVKQFPPGSPGRAAVVEMYKRAAGPMGDTVASALNSVGTGAGDEEQIKDHLAALGVPSGLKAAMALTGGDVHQLPKVMMDKEGQRAIYDAAAKAELPALVSKAQVFSRMIEQMPGNQFKGPDGKPSFSVADLEKVNPQLPADQQLTPAQFMTLRHAGNALVPYGFKTDEMVKKEREQQATASANASEWDRRETKRVEDRPVKADITHGVKGLTTEQNNALFGPEGAVTTGRLDPGKMNSRTASIFADAELTKPGTDFSKISGDIALGRNASFRQKAMTAEALPEIMGNMVAAGKKVGFSDVKTIGKMQAWVKGETNDPDLTEYMTQRNDALMTIAGVMRSSGMSDMAHKAETEVASPTMSPKALDAWLRGQTKSLQPRLDRYRAITRNEAPSGNPTSPTAPFSNADKEKRYQEWKAQQTK